MFVSISCLTLSSRGLYSTPRLMTRNERGPGCTWPQVYILTNPGTTGFSAENLELYWDLGIINNFWAKPSSKIFQRPLRKIRLTHYSSVLLFYTPWKNQKAFRFSDVFSGYRKATPGCNGLKPKAHFKFTFGKFQWAI